MDVFRIYICLVIALFCLKVEAQNYVSAAPWDNALSYNPSIVGLTTDESFQMNIFSRRSTRIDFATISGVPIRALDFDDTIDFIGALPRLRDIKNAYFLGYQKTIALKERFRLTGAAQLQHSDRDESTSQESTGLGFSINFHVKKLKSSRVSRYWSFGYQLNLLFQTTNKSVTSYAYNLLDAPIITFDEYNAQFRNTGTQQILSINYTYLIKEKTAINFGFVFSGSQYNVARNFNRSMDGIVNFRSNTQDEVRINAELQQSIGKKFMLQINALAARETQLAYGFGFRLGKHNLLKLLVINYPVIDNFATFDSFSAFNLSLDMKRIELALTLGIDNITFTQLGVVYRVEDRNTKSLISIGN